MNPKTSKCIILRADGRFQCRKLGIVFSPKAKEPIHCICEEGQVPSTEDFLPESPTLLGDMIENALTSIGITSDRVSKFLGRPCNCKERKEKLNRLHAWAIRVMGGHVEEGKRDIEEMLNE